MDILSIAILIFIIMESMNVAILYFWPGSQIRNGVGVFDAFHHSESEEQIVYLLSGQLGSGGKADLYFSAGSDFACWHRNSANVGSGSNDSVDCHLLLAAASYHQKIGCHGMYHAQRLFQSIGLDDFRLYGDVYSCTDRAYHNKGDVSMKTQQKSVHKKLIRAFYCAVAAGNLSRGLFLVCVRLLSRPRM